MNEIKIIGVLTDKFTLLYEYRGEKFYKTYIESIRSSGAYDTLPVVVSEDVAQLQDYTVVEVVGEVRTRNDEDRRVRVFIFASDISVSEAEDSNEVILEGYLCKDPKYRTTPLGREITDLTVAVNRRYGSDYLPCIAWGRSARKSSRFTVGERVEITGRLQSREYSKGVAYEVSIIEISSI